jgi:hypothetical protein
VPSARFHVHLHLTTSGPYCHNRNRPLVFSTATTLTHALCVFGFHNLTYTCLSSGPDCHTRNRLLVDVKTTVPFDAIVLAALRLPEGFTSRYVALLGLLRPFVVLVF